MCRYGFGGVISLLTFHFVAWSCSRVCRAVDLALLHLARCALVLHSTLLSVTNICKRSGGMMIKVKTLTGKEIEIDIEPNDTIERIKERVEEKEGIPPIQQRCVSLSNDRQSSCHLCTRAPASNNIELTGQLCLPRMPLR